MEITRKEVKKVSIKDALLEAVFEADFAGTDPNGSPVEETGEYSRKSSQVRTGDFNAAFNRLRIHMVCICEMPEAVQITEDNVYDFDPEQLMNYEITGYSIGGSDESAGVTITGKKLLESGQVLNLNVPFTKFEDEDGYIHGAALMSDIEACNSEVEEFLNGKWGIVQQELPGFETDTPNEADIDGVKMKVFNSKKEMEEAV